MYGIKAPNGTEQWQALLVLAVTSIQIEKSFNRFRELQFLHLQEKGMCKRYYQVN